nr:pyridoxamine 5'-phosphate oxidase family protein [Nocardia transvalensis]
MSDSDCLRLLSDVRVGRIAFSRYALPVIRPVNHIVDAEFVIVYAAAGMGTSPDHHVVTYEADALDHRTLLGWCVAVTGFAEPVTATREIHHYRNRLQRWIPGQHERIVRIVPDIIAGVEYVEHHDPDPSHRPGPPLPPPTFDR